MLSSLNKDIIIIIITISEFVCEVRTKFDDFKWSIKLIRELNRETGGHFLFL